MKDGSARPDKAALMILAGLEGNRLLAGLQAKERALIQPHMQAVQLQRGDILFEPGEDVARTYFPGPGVVASLLVIMPDGRAVEVATIGREGAIGGIVSAGHKPAFARALVQIGGAALRLDTAMLEIAKERSPVLRDLFSRYADTLLAQTMQSVACNALHAMDARLCRWLLTTHDRVGSDELALTQEYLAEMLGVQRTTVSAVAKLLQERGLISYSRGRLIVLDRAGLEAQACACYGLVRAHGHSVLPETQPQSRTSAHMES